MDGPGACPDSRSAPRVTAPPGTAYPWYVRLIFALQRRKYGAELEPARLWGRMPRTFLLLTLLYRSIDRAGSPIEAGLRALVQVRISQINGCGFCTDLNAATALERAVAPAKLAALAEYESSGLFTERERAALAYAEAATDPAKRVDDARFARLRAQFNEQAILELTALLAFQNLSSKFNAALAVPAQGFCVPREREARR
ncbi:MAG: carboxymuconolactone decarboxylase family protein [Burkholderiales bacterium]